MQDILAKADQVEAVYLSGDPYEKFDVNDFEMGFESPYKVKTIMSDLAKVRRVEHDEQRGQIIAFRLKNGTGIYVIALPDTDREFLYGPYYESSELYKRFETWGLIRK